MSATLREWVQRHWQLAIVAIVVVVTTAGVSAEFSPSHVSDSFGHFVRQWVETWVAPLATFVVAWVALQQVKVIRRGQRTEYAPVLRLDLSVSRTPLEFEPNENRYADPLQSDELDWHRAKDGEPQYLLLKIKNLQKHAAGGAFNIELYVSLFIPLEEFPFEFPLGHVECDTTELHTLVSLQGLNWSRIQVTGIDFCDREGNHYWKAHGLAYWERYQDERVEPSYITIGDEWDDDE